MTDTIAKKTQGDAPATSSRTAGTGSADPLAVQQLSDPLVDPLQGSGDMLGGSAGDAVQCEDANGGQPQIWLGEAERLPDPHAGAEGAHAGAEAGQTYTAGAGGEGGQRLVLGEAERIPVEGEQDGGGQIWLGEAERIEK